MSNFQTMLYQNSDANVEFSSEIQLMNFIYK